MPIYEYYSPDNNRIYSFYLKTIPHANRVPRCPDNLKYKMVKMISEFSVSREHAKSGEGTDNRNFDDPGMQAALAGMESEVAKIDEENPDPRQLAQLMRRMTEISGEKMPVSMEEIMRRLEEGEDPEKLEVEYGDLLDDEAEVLNNDSEDKSDEKHKKIDRRYKRPMTRDPKLYDFTDYI